MPKPFKALFAGILLISFLAGCASAPTKPPERSIDQAAFDNVLENLKQRPWYRELESENDISGGEQSVARCLRDDLEKAWKVNLSIVADVDRAARGSVVRRVCQGLIKCNNTYLSTPSSLRKLHCTTWKGY